jgi:hypothetical protein
MNTQLSTATRVGGFLLALAAVFGLALAVGTRVGPVGEPAQAHSSSGSGSAHGGAEDHETSSSAAVVEESLAVPGGLMNTQDGHTLSLISPQTSAGTNRQVSFVVTGPDGKPVTTYQREHDKDLHFIAVRRDFTGFQHVHPTLGPDGTWLTDLDLTPGQWRTFADFTPAGGDPLTLGADLSVPGDYAPAEPAVEKRTATVDGYTVTLAGDLVAGEHSSLTLRVTKGGEPVTDLQPYLGAYGHLVTLRSGDLAYLHVHPGGEPGDGKTDPGPDISFCAGVPSAGAYHLYLDFKHDGVVRTAQFRLETTPSSSTAGETSHGSEGSAGSDGHGDH